MHFQAILDMAENPRTIHRGYSPSGIICNLGNWLMDVKTTLTLDYLVVASQMLRCRE